MNFLGHYYLDSQKIVPNSCCQMDGFPFKKHIPRDHWGTIVVLKPLPEAQTYSLCRASQELGTSTPQKSMGVGNVKRIQ